VQLHPINASLVHVLTHPFSCHVPFSLHCF